MAESFLAKTAKGGPAGATGERRRKGEGKEGGREAGYDAGPGADTPISGERCLVGQEGGGTWGREHCYCIAMPAIRQAGNGARRRWWGRRLRRDCIVAT